MELTATNSIERPTEIVVPEKYQHSPRLTLWYRHGFSKAWRGFAPTEDWLERLQEDAPASEAYYAGHQAGEASRK